MHSARISKAELALWGYVNSVRNSAIYLTLLACAALSILTDLKRPRGGRKGNTKDICPNHWVMRRSLLKKNSKGQKQSMNIGKMRFFWGGKWDVRPHERSPHHRSLA